MKEKKLENIILLSDPASVPLTKEIYSILSKKSIAGLKEFNPEDLYINRFGDGEPDIEIKTNVRKKTVFIIKSPYAVKEKYDLESEKPTMQFSSAKTYEELFLIFDALKRSSVKEIINVMFYMPYLRQDRRNKPRTPISAKLYAELTEAALEKVEKKRILTLEPHFKQAQGYYEIPFDDLKASIFFAEYLERGSLNLEEFVIVSPDITGGERAGSLAKYLNRPLIVAYKVRDPETRELKLKGFLKMDEVDLKGKKALLCDDMVDSGGTLIENATFLIEKEKVSEVHACCPHAVLSGIAKQRLKDAGIKLIVSNSIPFLDKESYDNIEVVSLAPMAAEAFFQTIHENGSLSTNLFNYENYKKLVRNSL